MRFKDNATAITGAGRGISRAAAELSAREGAKVVVLELSAEDGREVVRVISEAGGRVHFIRTDVADPASVASALTESDRQFGRLDVLYHNALVYLGGNAGPLADVAWETWRRVLSINLDGLLSLHPACPAVGPASGWSDHQHGLQRIANWHPELRCLHCQQGCDPGSDAVDMPGEGGVT
jgi:NAD(P)-dependent dehydrogenase (short-subunit alcohol dehydrogenase family)